MASIWTTAEQNAWRPPERLTVSEWADKYRILPPGVSAEPGRWRTDRTPYLRVVMDCMGDPFTQELVLMSGPQIGKSEALRCAQGYWIDQDPAPTLCVFPTEAAAKENLVERVVPMIKATPQLAQYLTGRVYDLKLSQLTLRSMSIYAGHAGSPQTLATRPCRYVECDETDKYPAFSGKEADPITLADARTRTYGSRRKLIQTSTPTTREGPIAVGWYNSPYRYRYNWACPKCGRQSPLVFDKFDWGTGGRLIPDGEQRLVLADALEAGREAVWWGCECGHRIVEADKPKCNAAGRWLDEQGRPVDPRASRKAFQVPAAISPWVGWGRLCAEYLRTRGTLVGLMAFANQWEGLPFEERIAKVSIEDLREKKSAGVRGALPSWARAVIVTADAGGDHVWWVARAWGPNYRSRLIDYGRAFSFEELSKTCLRSWPYEDTRFGSLTTMLLFIDAGGTRTIDSGSRTNEVYRYSLTDSRIAALKGSDGKGQGFQNKPIFSKRVTHNPPGVNQSPFDVVLHLVNVGYFKDILANRLREKLPDGTSLWEELPGVDDDYLAQLASEHRVVERDGRRVIARWKPVSRGVPNHFWDCSVYQCAAADMVRVDLLGEPTPLLEVEQPKREPTNVKPPNGFVDQRDRPWLLNRR